MTAVANDTEVSMTDSTPLLEIGVQVEAVTQVGCMRGVYLGRYEATVLLALADNRVHDVPEGSVLTVLADADPATMPLVWALRDEAVLRRRMRDDHQAWKDRLVELAHDEANKRGWCSEFDDLLGSLDLPGRVREFDFEVTFTSAVTVTVEGTNADDAGERIDAVTVIETLRSLLGYEDIDIDITTIE